MWDFQYSRMRILHFNIHGYRMRILYIIFYFTRVIKISSAVPATDDEENSENYAIIKLMNE